METVSQEILYYKNANGQEPFREWFDSLRDRRTQQKVDVRLRRMKLGNFGDCHSVGYGVYELRVHWGPGCRVYFGKRGVSVVVLLAGGDKSSQTKDIAAAQAYWKEYEESQS